MKIAEIKGDNSTKIGEIWRKEAPAEFPMLPDSESVAIQQKCHRRLPLPKAVGSGDPSWGTPMGIQHLQRW